MRRQRGGYSASIHLESQGWERALAPALLQVSLVLVLGERHPAVIIADDPAIAIATANKGFRSRMTRRRACARRRGMWRWAGRRVPTGQGDNAVVLGMLNMRRIPTRGRRQVVPVVQPTRKRDGGMPRGSGPRTRPPSWWLMGGRLLCVRIDARRRLPVQLVALHLPTLKRSKSKTNTSLARANPLGRRVRRQLGPHAATTSHRHLVRAAL